MTSRKRIVFRIVVLIIAVSVVGYIAYRNRLQVEAKLWHWRHGYICRMGTYDVFVPEHWLPTHDVADDLLLYDTKTGSSIRVFLLPPLRDVEFWETKHRQKLENDHVNKVVDHALHIGDQRVVCVGGTEFQDELKIPAPNVISLDCQSTGTLHLMFVGRDSELETFYSIASRIKRIN